MSSALRLRAARATRSKAAPVHLRATLAPRAARAPPRCAPRRATMRCSASAVGPAAASLRDWATARGVKFFLLSYTDLFGVQRSKLVPTSAMDAMQKTGASFAGFASYLDSSPSEPDTFAMPDAACAVQLPWKKEVAWVPSDLVSRGTLIASAPRNVLKAQVKAAAALGFNVKSGVECEFFLLTPDASRPADTADDAAKPCYDQQALMRQYDLIAEVSDYMAELGWEPYQNDHEDANGQFEMNWGYDDVLVTADRHAFFKFMLRSCAEARGQRVTFMPKPFITRTGTGAHVHVSAWGLPGTPDYGRNLFKDTVNGELGLTPLAYSFMAGVLDSAQGLCALTNPTVNSYKRLNGAVVRSGSTWSPNTVSYGGNNRTHMLRIPDAGRFEFRLPDGACNPYLVQAGLMAAGIAGVVAKAIPGPRSDENYYEVRPPPHVRTLPGNLLDAVRALQADAPLRAHLGDAFVDSYAKLKLASWRDYCSHITQWELDNTLDC